MPGLGSKDIPTTRLHAKLLAGATSLRQAVRQGPGVTEYKMRPGVGFRAALFVKRPTGTVPPWIGFVEQGTHESLKGLRNRGVSAVLVVKRNRILMAFTFGHGRYLVDEKYVVSDFGLKTALNVIDPKGLRSMDRLAIEDQAVHNRSQASRDSDMGVFGIDVGRDILRAAVGKAKDGIPFSTVAGSEDTLAFGVRAEYGHLGEIVDLVVKHYRSSDYRRDYEWVDHIQRISDADKVFRLNNQLLKELKGRRKGVGLSPPEPLDWEGVDGFTYPRRRKATKSLDPSPSLLGYLQYRDLTSLDLRRLKSDRVVVVRDGVAGQRWSIFKCLHFEVRDRSESFVLAGGEWYRLDRAFVRRVKRELSRIERSPRALPMATRVGGKFEAEEDYNRRVATGTIALLDRKTIRCRDSATPIEPCDLLTADRNLIHVKRIDNPKSSTLSHLFAQGRVASEALVSDEGFRSEFRMKLANLSPSWEGRIPLKRVSATAYTVTLAFLHAPSGWTPQDLPFFSQLNMARTHQAITRLGFKCNYLSIEAGE